METTSTWVNPLHARQARLAADVFEHSATRNARRPHYVGADSHEETNSKQLSWGHTCLIDDVPLIPEAVGPGSEKEAK